MNSGQLLTFHQLCPNTSFLHTLHSTAQLSDLKNVSKYSELKTLIFEEKPEVEYSQMTEFLLNDLKPNNKLTKISFPQFKNPGKDEEQIFKFYKTLFEKTNLTEFAIPSFFTKKVAKLFSSWIENNSCLRVLDFNRKKILKNSQQ
jgi:hypothetical protein